MPLVTNTCLKQRSWSCWHLLLNNGYHFALLSILPRKIHNNAKTMWGEKLVNFLKKWRLWILPFTIICYGFGVLIFLPLFLTKSVRDGFNRRDQEIFVGGIFVMLALPISIWEIIQHVIHFTEPKLQKHIIRYLFIAFHYLLCNDFYLIFF